ncbi:MAG: ribonuclease P protein component [Xanthomonadales bacterium]|nr:Ribonuclease P protein component [Xanthomonadales bacterium]MCC6594653.1 ribonuclease P protein component [Xanthomonadales bacterium]MCE7931476.1 ribonuclease P protein component [Xanthomonadales bacterium PRO6]
MPGARFPRPARLLLPSEFDRVFQSGRRERGRFFVCVVAVGVGEAARIGFAVGRKHLPAAHDRNLVKRLARESFRLRRARMPQVDLVLVPGRDVVRGDRRSLRADLDALFDRLITAPPTPDPERRPDSAAGGENTR